MKKPRILVVGPMPPPYNGMSVVTQSLIASNINEEYEIFLLDLSDNRGIKNIGKFDVTNIILALKHGIQFLLLLLSQRPNLVYIPISQNIPGYLRDCLFLIPAKLLRYKVIIHLHGGSFHHFYRSLPKLIKYLVKWTLSSVSKAIVLGDKLLSIFDGILPIDRVVSVPNGIAWDYTRSLLTKETQLSRSRIIYLGNLIKSKGFLDVVRSIPIVVKECPNVEFIFAGEVTNSQDLEAAQEIIDKNDLSKSVRFTGRVVGDEKRQLLEDSDIFVFPSFFPFEGQPLVILEAMASGLPVISTDQGVITETVQDGVTGIIVPKQDPSVLAEKIVYLLINDASRKEMGKAGRERFRNFYTLDTWVQNLNKVFTSVLQDN